MFSFGVVNLDTVFDMKILQKIYWDQSAFFPVENRQICASVFLSLSSLLRLRRTSVKLPVFLLLPLMEKDKHSKCLSTSSLSSWRPEHEWSQCAHQGSSPLLYHNHGTAPGSALVGTKHHHAAGIASVTSQGHQHQWEEVESSSENHTSIVTALSSLINSL